MIINSLETNKKQWIITPMIYMKLLELEENKNRRKKQIMVIKQLS